MRTIRTTFATILTALAFVAFESGADAQARRTEPRSTTGTSARPSRTVRSAAPSDRKQPAACPSVNTSGDKKPSTTVTRPAGQRRPSGNVAVPSKPANDAGYKRPDRDKPVSVTRPGARPNRPSGNASSGRPSVRPDAGHAGKPGKPVQNRPDRRPEPPKVHPHDRDFIVYDRPSHFWTGHNHCYGHRVRILPSHVRRYVYHGVTYYCYNDIWYRPFGGHYVVCRPPLGTVLAANLIADMTWAAVRLSYYYTVANTYDKISENNAYIAQQNAVIAQNNATIAAQNQTIAMNQQLAAQAYGLANELGLVQSYAAAGSPYYYQDGVFYSVDSDNEYKVILPPAGALVETLPEDYEMVTLGGKEYYKVDDTVYRVTISEGKPYFEVLGQLYA